jgi:hypothetical protein
LPRVASQRDTSAADDNRTFQPVLKNIFDQFNNGGAFGSF